ncbi:hypothetical protein OB13_02390 [Pontibacter sp. HJ8]
MCCGTLLLSSCNDCAPSVITPFQPEETSWTVYSQGATLKMADERDSVYTFTHTRLSSDPVPGEGFEVTDACIEQYDTRRASVMQESSTTPKKKLPGLSVIALKRPNDLQVTLAVSNRANFQIPDINTPQHASLVVKGVTYTNVFSIINPDSSTQGVSRILFNKEFGFLRVVYYNDSVLKNKVLERVPG